MSEANKFVEEWCRESNKNGLEKYVAEKEAEANSKGKKAGILETAKNMLFKDIPTNIILEVTGLSEKELNKLKSKIC